MKMKKKENEKNAIGHGFAFIAIVLTCLTLSGVLFWSCETDLNIDSSIPAPTNLRATAEVGSSGLRITLTWTPVSGLMYYAVYRSADKSWKNYQCIDSSHNSTVYTDTSSALKASTTYYYKVAAKKGMFTNDPIGKLSKSAEVYIPAAGTTINSLPAPQNLTAVSTSTSQITLSWTPVDGASYYNVYRTTDSTWQNFSLISSSVSNTVYSDYSLSSGTTYYYKVGAKRSNSSTDLVGELSEAVSATTRSASDNSGNLAAPAPENVTATAHGKVITLEWNAVAGASSYQIYGSFTSGGTFVYIGSISGTAFNVTSMAEYGPIPLEPNTTYYFKVRASVSGSELSSEVSATTGT
jgi:fibronectin type 3 domain-containing protein